MKGRDVLAVFNRGLISRLALARTDVSRVALSASVQKNWMPRTLGSMMLRPGLEFKGVAVSDGVDLPFIFSNDDVASLELSAGKLRIWESGDTLLTRDAVSASVVNGQFDTDLSGWNDADEGSSASTWQSGGFMKLLGSGFLAAKRQQQVTVSEPTSLHSLRIVVTQGPVLLRVGSTAGADNVFRQAVLRTGSHSIAFVPGGDFWIEFSSSLTYPSLIASCEIEADGVVELPTIWETADDCRLVRWAQSSDVLFCACRGYRQQRIERRPNNSWSVVDFVSNNGPFLTENTDSIRLTPSDISGEITLTSSAQIFEAGHVGALFQLTSQGQLVEASLSDELSYTDPIRVTGVEAGRIFTITRLGTWEGTLRLERSIGEVGAWVEVASYTANGVVDYNDDLDNSIAFYRIGFGAGDYTSGTADVSLDYAVGSITGEVRIASITDEQTAQANVISALGGAEATEIWSEGSWSDKNGWPEVVTIWEGRLWWHGNARNYGSVSDAFTSFDPDVDGDSGPINRRIGEGAVNRANWSLPLQRLLVGTDGAEHSIRSNSFDEPVTPSNYNSKSRSTEGSAPIPAVHAGDTGYFVGKSTKRIFEVGYISEAYDYGTSRATLLVPEIGDAGFVRIAVQQEPDVRLHAVRADGTVAVLVRDISEDVNCWVEVETDGFVEDVHVLPGIEEDRVIYRVRREIGGSDVIYREEWAKETECRGGDVSRCADSFLVGAGRVDGLDHLNGRRVVVWADGKDQGEFDVSNGTIDQTFSNWCVGLGYTARYKSAKLAVNLRDTGSSLLMRSRIDHIGLIMADTHAQGLKYGPSFDVLDDLPQVENGAVVDPDTVWESYDEDVIEFPGEWSTDSRICLEAQAPRPCTVLAAIMSHDRQQA